MERHLLLTVSEQKSALYGVNFLGHFFGNKEGLRVTLFYTSPRPPAVWEGEKTVETMALKEEQARQYEIKGRKAVESAKRELVRQGFSPEQIAAKRRVRVVSKATDIVQEGEKGLYDGVVLGRRGLSWLEAAFDESVSRDVLTTEVSFPIWICRSPEPGRRNVLLCMDGSEAAYRAADHVGFILGDRREHGVTLLTVRKNGVPSPEETETIFHRGRELLRVGGLPLEMVTAKTVEGGNIAKTILEESGVGRFAVVAAGRTGAGEGLLKKIFMGSTSNALFHGLQGAALWVCRG